MLKRIPNHHMLKLRTINLLSSKIIVQVEESGCGKRFFPVLMKSSKSSFISLWSKAEFVFFNANDGTWGATFLFFHVDHEAKYCGSVENPN